MSVHLGHIELYFQEVEVIIRGSTYFATVKFQGIKNAII